MKVSTSSRRAALLRRVNHRTKSSCSLVFPALPGLADHYTKAVAGALAATGRPLNRSSALKCKKAISKAIDETFAITHSGAVVVSWQSVQGDTDATLTVTTECKTIEETYAYWVANRKPPLFGKNPDAKVMDVAAREFLNTSGGLTVLDVGAGDGRNTIPLANSGYRVDALDLSPDLLQSLRAQANSAGVALNTVCGSLFDTKLKTPRNKYRLVVMAEVSTHWRGQTDLCRALARVASLLEQGGTGLVNMHLANAGFNPSQLERDFSQVAWCPVFTRKQVKAALAGLPLALLEDDSAVAYEKTHGKGWPPTGWFERWATGAEVLDLPPSQSQFELRWLTFRKT